ncbi:hypothetical protein ABIC63_000551 [Pseudacidovorax sp. 1753]|uniref:hypothetical protein n=1 Tax=Pseudacidovorax sp. 1753 TaxID=3156419 RepID=UPI00339A7B49
MSNFRDYVTSTAFALTISHRQIQCMCEIDQYGASYRLLTTFQALERKGLVERVKSDEQFKEGALIQLTDAGRAVIPLLKLAGLYVEMPKWDPQPPAPAFDVEVEHAPGQKPRIVFRERPEGAPSPT